MEEKHNETKLAGGENLVKGIVEDKARVGFKCHLKEFECFGQVVK